MTASVARAVGTGDPRGRRAAATRLDIGSTPHCGEYTLPALPDRLDVRDDSLIEPAAVARHGAPGGAAVRRAPRPGRPSGVYDVVIDAAGSESGLARCPELARPDGRVVLVDVYHGLVPFPSPGS